MKQRTIIKTLVWLVAITALVVTKTSGTNYLYLLGGMCWMVIISAMHCKLQVKIEEV